MAGGPHPTGPRPAPKPSRGYTLGPARSWGTWTGPSAAVPGAPRASPAVSQVDAQIAALKQFYAEMEAQQRKELERQVAEQRARAQYLAQALGPIAGQIEGIVNRQTGSSTQFAQGFSDTVEQIANQSAGAANADLAKFGMPGQIEGHGTEASDALYGTYGYIPATTLSQAGAAQAGAAAMLPATALRQGEQQIAGLYSAFNSGPLADINAKRLELIANRPKMIADARSARRKDAADLYSAGLISQREFAKRMGVKDWRKFSNQIGGQGAPAKVNTTLSKSLGYLVDDYGQPIRNAKGKPIALPQDAGDVEKFGSASSGYWAWNPDTGEIVNLLPPQAKTYAPKGQQLKTLKDGSTAVFDPNTGQTVVIAPPPKGSSKPKLTAAQQARYRGAAQEFAANAFTGVTEKDGTVHPPLSLAEALEEIKKTDIPWSIAKAVLVKYYRQRFVGPLPPPGYKPPKSKPSGKAEPAKGGQNASFSPYSPTSQVTGSVVNLALTQLGKPYVFGSGPDTSSFDCSDLIQWAYKQVGINIPRTTWQQIKVGTPVAWGQFQPGDLVFTNKGGHVMLYIGNGKLISAPYTGSVVKIVDLAGYKNSFVTARRILSSGMSV